MSGLHRPMCDYRIAEAYRQERYCRNYARWVVEWVTPDDGTAMRRKEVSHRCSSHTESGFFPKGASGITTALLDVRCDVCSRVTPHTHCPECGGTDHSASNCDMAG